MKKYKSIKGITLISLVITIIILLILAGISIQAITSDNGLFARAKQAKEETLINEGKEQIELAIADLMAKKSANGEELTKEDLSSINSDKINVESTDSFPVIVKYNNYRYNVDEKFLVSYTDNVSLTELTFTTEPKGYYGKDKVKVLYQITNPNGIKSIQCPNETDRVLVNGKTSVGFDFETTENGIYTVKIVDSNGIEVTKEIVIEGLHETTFKFNLGIENPNFSNHQGTPEYKGPEEGMYLNNAVIKADFPLSDNFTMLIEVKDIEVPVGYTCSMICSYGSAGPYVGGRVIGIGAESDVTQDRIMISGWPGVSDSSVFHDSDTSRLKKGQWYRLSIKWDGSNFALFINDSKVGMYNGASIKQIPLYIGGFNNAGTSSSGVNWGYSNGYYRNFAIYDRALTDEEIQNYTF